MVKVVKRTLSYFPLLMTTIDEIERKSLLTYTNTHTFTHTHIYMNVVFGRLLVTIDLYNYYDLIYLLELTVLKNMFEYGQFWLNCK